MIKVDEVQAALGDGYSIKDWEDEWEIDTEKGAAILWFKPEAGLANARFGIYYKPDEIPADPMGIDEGVLGNIRASLERVFQDGHQPDWEQRNYSRSGEPEFDWQDQDGNYSLTFELIKNVTTTQELIDEVKWAQETGSNAWMDEVDPE